MLVSFLVAAAGVSAGSESVLALTTTFRLTAPPVAVAIAPGGVWVVVETQPQNAELWQLDPKTGKRLRSFVIGPTGPDIGAVVSTASGVWAGAGGHVIYVNPSQPGHVRRARVSGTVSGLAFGFGSVWVTTIGLRRNFVVKLSPIALSVRARIETAGADAVAAALGSVWAVGGQSLARVRPRTDRVINVRPIAGGTTDLATSAHRLWLLGGRTVFAINGAGHVRRRLTLPFGAARIAISNERLWAIDNCGCAIGQLTEMNLRTGQRLGSWAVGTTPVAVAAENDQVWVATFGNSTLARIRR
jgi:hypothetical protein